MSRIGLPLTIDAIPPAEDIRAEIDCSECDLFEDGGRATEPFTVSDPFTGNTVTIAAGGKHTFSKGRNKYGAGELMGRAGATATSLSMARVYR